VTDHRPVPRGVLPRGTQTWIMAGLAVGVIGIILIAGRPEPPARPAAAVSTAPQAPNPDRVRDYQDRLRMVETRAAHEAQASAAMPPPAPSSTYEHAGSPPPDDPLVAERKRRDYHSLFASNVVLSRRTAHERPDAGGVTSNVSTGTRLAGDAGATTSIDEIADAAVRASARAGLASGTPSALAFVPPTTTTRDPLPPESERERPTRTDAIRAAGPLHRVLEGTVIDTVLTNRLDGSVTAPVNCLVTNAIYSHSRQHILIPAGARALGETKPIQAFGEARLAVSFHRLVMPDGSAYSLDAFLGTNQVGDAGLRDRVNQHYWSTFGAAGAVGLISGLAQVLGTAGLSRGTGDRTVILAGSAGDATAQASVPTMNRFLNRMPTITIREGHRVKVYLTSDLELPAYDPAAGRDRF
jgi:type IV secretion system protein TrbI